MKKRLILIIIVFMLINITSCNNKQQHNNTNTKISKSDFMLNTYIIITLFDTEDETLFEPIFNNIKELENILSVHVATSDLYKLRENAGKKYTKVSDETMEVMKKSIKYSEFSEGLFDVTLGPLIELWGIGTTKEKVPKQEEIKETLLLIDYKKININEEKKEIMLEKEGMFIDFGAIAKGYIADKTAEKIKELGIKSAIINLGGNVLLLGSRPDNSDFKIGIQDPKEARGGYLGTVKASDLSIVTSGDYERYFEKDGQRYHHIINPFTGFPSDNNLKSVSIITSSSFDSDALSTTILLLGLEKGLTKVNSLENVEAIFVTKDNKIYLTEGIRDKFELTNKEYKIAD